MSTTNVPSFTEEYGLFYLWRPEPLPSHIQLVGEFKSEKEMQVHSVTIFGEQAVKRNPQ